VKIHTVNRRNYGARKVHAQIKRDCHPVDRCTVERLMGREGLRGFSRRRGPT
jgi:putative transposase